MLQQANLRFMEPRRMELGAARGFSRSDANTAAAMLVGWALYYVLARQLLALKFKPASGGVAVDTHESLRARSWLLSLLMSAILTVVGGYYIHVVFATYWAEGWHAVHDYMSSTTPLSRHLNLAFSTFLLADLSIGYMDYRKHLALLTGYVHHTVYFFTLVWFMFEHLDNFFPSFAPCELPTLMLAIGSIHAPWRIDLPMGVSFFFTRVLYCGALFFIIAWVEGPYKLRSWLGTGILLLHVFWFRSWLRSYSRLRQQRRKGESGPTEDPQQEHQQLFDDGVAAPHHYDIGAV